MITIEFLWFEPLIAAIILFPLIGMMGERPLRYLTFITLGTTAGYIMSLLV